MLLSEKRRKWIWWQTGKYLNNKIIIIIKVIIKIIKYVRKLKQSKKWKIIATLKYKWLKWKLKPRKRIRIRIKINPSKLVNWTKWRRFTNEWF